jgi:tetratricopeptide (TPR) repeat protein
MDLFDDLLSRESEPEPEEDETPDSGTTSSGSDMPDFESEDGSWDDLLSGLAYDEEPEADEDEPSGRGRPRDRGGRRLSIVQMAILGVLGLFVVAVWVVIGMMIVRSIPADAPEDPDSEADVTVVSYADATPIESSGTVTQTPTLTPASDEGEPVREGEQPASTVQPTVTPTPTRVPPVSTVYDRQIAEDPDNVDLYLQRGREYLSLGVYQAALEDFQKAKSLEKERAEAYVGMGWSQYYLAQWEAAEASFGTAVAFNQDLPDAHVGLGKLFYYQGRYGEAVSEFDWAAEIDRGDAEAEAWLAIAAARQGDPTEAMGAVTRALSITEDLPLVYIARSWAYRAQDPPDLESAHGDLIYARNLAPNDFHALNALARFYLAHRPERLVEAEQLATYARNWAKNPIQEAVALQTLGRIYLRQDRTEEARRVLSEAANRVTSNGKIVLVDLVDDLERARGGS